MKLVVSGVVSLVQEVFLKQSLRLLSYNWHAVIGSLLSRELGAIHTIEVSRHKLSIAVGIIGNIDERRFDLV